MDKDENPFEILGISSDADEKTIKKAYRDAARVHHPDKQTTDEDRESASAEFAKIADAYDLLQDPVRRYDWRMANEGKLNQSNHSQKPASPPKPSTTSCPMGSPRGRSPKRPRDRTPTRAQQGSGTKTPLSKSPLRKPKAAGAESMNRGSGHRATVTTKRPVSPKRSARPPPPSPVSPRRKVPIPPSPVSPRRKVPPSMKSPVSPRRKVPTPPSPVSPRRKVPTSMKSPSSPQRPQRPMKNPASPRRARQSMKPSNGRASSPVPPSKSPRQSLPPPRSPLQKNKMLKHMTKFTNLLD